MHYKIILLFLFFFGEIFSQEIVKIDIKDFGEVNAIKNGEVFTVDLGELGKFDFKGSIDPISLEGSAGIDDLKSFPGYKLFTKIDLKEIGLKIEKSGLEISAAVETKGSLAKLFSFFKIDKPLLGVTVKVGKKEFALSGELDFSNNPILVSIAKNTSMKLEKFGIGADISSGVGAEMALAVNAEVKLKPTKFDPELQTVLEFSYNLKSQEISVAGSMTDTWENPLGISNVLKNNNVLTLSNTAVEIGWIPGTPSPTTLGFAVEKGKFFQLDFGIILGLSLDDGKIALKGNRNEITMNDMLTIMREGFNLKVPDVFPDDIYIKDAQILFSPIGGKVGEVEIERGFKLKGNAKLLNAVNADVDFYANLKDGFYLDYNIDNKLKDLVKKELKKVKVIAAIVNPMLSTFQMRKANVHLEAASDLNLMGKTHLEVSVFNKKLPIPDMNASLDVKQIVKHMVDAIVDKYGAQATKIAKNVGKAAKKSKDIAGKAFKEVGRQAKIVAKHSLHKEKKCMNECIPKRVKQLANPVLDGSKKALKSFYNDVVNDLKPIVGSNASETKKFRNDIIKSEWKSLIKELDKQWKKVNGDKDYVRYFVRKKKAEEGGRKYRSLVDKEKDKYTKYKEYIYNKLMTIK